MPYKIKTIQRNNQVYLDALDLDTGCKYGPTEIFVGLSRNTIEANIDTPAVFERVTDTGIAVRHPLYGETLELHLLVQTGDQQRLNLLENKIEGLVNQVGDLVLENQAKDARIGQLELEIQRKHMESGFVQIIYGQPDNTLAADTRDERICRRPVAFQRAFENPPRIALSFTWIGACHPGRLTVFRTIPENVTRNGFDIVCSTWNDSIVNNVEVTWIAYQD